jgi:hypothetical protein
MPTLIKVMRNTPRPIMYLVTLTNGKTITVFAESPTLAAKQINKRAEHGRSAPAQKVEVYR